MDITKNDHPAVPQQPLNSYKLLSFDIYGTLVNWEETVGTHVAALQDFLPASHPLKIDVAGLVRKWSNVEDELKINHPRLLYHELLAESYKLLARRELHIDTQSIDDADLDSRAAAFGNSVRDWKAFPDTVPALRTLKAMGLKLVPLSNITNVAFAKTNSGALDSFPFDAVFTAEDIGSYKPDLHNFEYLFEKADSLFGVKKQEVLHVAHGLMEDHEPAKKLGFQSVWIARPGSVRGTRENADAGLASGRWAYGWEAPTLGDLAEAIKQSKGE
ncbi:MAG: hypothetical protein Q9162_003144 [Coniocarpon cinnabarinum]